MATLMATKRLRQDYIRLQRDPVPYISATPLPSNILEWSARWLLVTTSVFVYLLKHIKIHTQALCGERTRRHSLLWFVI